MTRAGHFKAWRFGTHFGHDGRHGRKCFIARGGQRSGIFECIFYSLDYAGALRKGFTWRLGGGDALDDSLDGFRA